MRSIVAILFLVLAALTALSCSKSDSSDTASDNGGKGASPLTDGKYRLTDATYAGGSTAETQYTLENNTFEGGVAWSTAKSKYLLEYTGSVTYKYSGGSTKSGCTAGSRIYSFKLDASNSVKEENLDQKCTTDFGPIDTTLTVLSDKIEPLSEKTIRRTTQLLIQGETWTYKYTLVR